MFNEKIFSCVPVAHTCNPSYSEAEIWRIAVQSQPGQIVYKTYLEKSPSQNKGGWAGGVARYRL
jgi:hypothetical protein